MVQFSIGALWQRLTGVYRRQVKRAHDFLQRRPHRSFRRTLRRDLPKHPRLPGYLSFTRYSVRTIWAHKRTFALLLLLYVVVHTLLVGMASQSQYADLADALTSEAPGIFGGNFGAFEQTATLFLSAVTGSLNNPLGEVQQLYLALLGIFGWLAVVWYLRQRMNDNPVSVRDALYNSGAPFLSTLVVVVLILLQALPAVIAVIAYASALNAGALQGGVESMMFAVAAGLLVILSLYWMTSSFFAALIVTIPGTYPMRAVRMAGDIVLGRRLSVMFRLLWLVLLLLVWWALLLIPAIILSDKISVEWLPLVPLTMQVLSASSVLFSAAYIYLLYRKMIDEPAAS